MASMIEYVDGVSCVPEVVHDFLILDEAFRTAVGYDDSLVASGALKRDRSDPDIVDAAEIVAFSNNCPEGSNLPFVDSWKVSLPR